MSSNRLTLGYVLSACQFQENVIITENNQNKLLRAVNFRCKIDVALGYLSRETSILQHFRA